MTVIVFDIDGTLLHSHGCGLAATRMAMETFFGTIGSLDDFQFGGKTDLQMLEETLDGHFEREQIADLLADYEEVYAQVLDHIIDEYNVRPCLGAQDFVEHCHDNDAITMGLLTGNMERSAMIKLMSAGYNPHMFSFGVFGSEAPQRHALAHIAIERIHERTGQTVSNERICFVGDTPLDIACAKEIGAQSVAVTTGPYTYDELVVHKPDIIVENLLDFENILSALR